MKKILFSLIACSSLFCTPQAIVFDFGGVLTQGSNREVAVNFIRDTFKLSQIEFDKVNHEKHHAMLQGKTDEEFWIEYAKKKGTKLPDNWVQSFTAVMKEAIGINSQMYDLVEELRKKQLPVGLLSNIEERHEKLLRRYGLYDPFEPCLLSCVMGVAKPDPKAYEILLSELQYPASDIVFIDDKLSNIEAAKKMGIDAILFESETQLRQELKQRGIL